MATGKEGSDVVSHECENKCISREHASNLTAALTKRSLSDEKVAAYLKWCCVRYSKAKDSDGRNLIHLASSVGRLKLLNFLLKHKDVNINEKDEESHYTPLHRSIFYGQLHCAVRLIEQGANVEQLDLDGLTPLDHLMKDRLSIIQYNNSQPCEVYVWGTNTNYTLGIGRHQSRANPEPLDMFRRHGISIKQVLMSKFHSAFISHDDKIWTCGHGQGGRLGLGDELTQLTPKAIKLPFNSKVSTVALGRDHTLLLIENKSAKSVWSFGLNTYHQLGHSPPPDKVLSPKVIKSLTNDNIIGISASKYHSVFWTEDEVYTCGLNGGQLGQVKGSETTITIPKPVSFRHLKGIQHVASSDGATVLSNYKGEVYLLYEYQCKRIVSKSRLFMPKRICVFGGHLDHKINVGGLQEKGGDELKIIIITDCDTIYLWQETTCEVSPCELSLRRKIRISDVALNRNSLLLVCGDGEAFQGEIKTKKKKPNCDTEKLASRKFSSCMSPREEYIKLKRIPHIHRGVQVTSDLKGLNLAITQVHPKAWLMMLPEVLSKRDLEEDMKRLYETIDQFDPSHDVTFEVDGHLLSAHRYIVAHSSPVLEEMMKKAVQDNGSCHVKIENVMTQIFRRILCFLYTRDCDFLHKGVCPVRFDSSVKQNEIREVRDIPDDLIDMEAISAFEYNKMRSSWKKKPVKIKDKDNPIKLLKAAAKRFEIADLEKKLETVRYENGYIIQTVDTLPPVRVQFDRKNLDYMSDVSFQSEDNIIIKAHKCILIARLEYFDCMFNQRWLESTKKTAIYLPFPGKVLELLMHYLYTDEAPGVVCTEDPDIAIRTLELAEQFLCNGLKEYAEVALGHMISLKNAAEILQIAFTYNANQLKICSMEFICLNLPAILESRSLEIVHDSALMELTKYYRSGNLCICTRNITEYENAPEDSLVDLIAKTSPVSLDSVEEDISTKLASKSSKKQREKRNSESKRARNVSTGSFTSEEELEPLQTFDFCQDAAREEEAWVKVVNHPTKQQKNAQIKVRVPLEEAKLMSQPVQQEKLISLNKIKIIKEEKENIQHSQKEFQLLSTCSEKEFPTLNASLTERSFTGHPQSPRQSQEVFKKFVKLSQKQRKRLAAQSVSEDEDTLKKAEVTIKSPWALPKNESILLIDIMKEESKANNAGQNTPLASSPPWLGTAGPGSSLSAVMASERKQRELLAKMKSKPLRYTQMEDKAMEDLLLLYNANDVTDERITVRRAEYKFLSPPVWVTSRK